MYSMNTDNQEIWVIGYGDPHLGDDGLGFYIVDILKKLITCKEKVYFRCLSHLTPGLIKDLRNASVVIFIDATVERLKKGWRLLKVQPNLDFLPFLTNQATPEYLLALFQSLYKRCPSTWLVSVQGYDFSLEEGFYPETERNIEGAISFVYRFVEKIQNQNKKHENISYLASNEFNLKTN